MAKSLNTGIRDESVADVKRRVWEHTPRNRNANLDKVKNFSLSEHVSIGRPTSFVLSKNETVVLNDNTHGKLFRLPADLSSIVEFSSVRLSRPTIIKENGNYLFVYDESGINLFDSTGQLVKAVRPFLRIEDFDVAESDSYVISLSDAKADIDPSYVALFDSNGKRVVSLDTSSEERSVSYPDIENKALVELNDGKVYVCYKYDPICEIYDVNTNSRIASFEIRDVTFPALRELKKDASFVHPEPGKFKFPKFIAAFKIRNDRIFLLLHAPSPEIVELDLLGNEISRYISSETQIIDYFGFDVRLGKYTKQFFVGTVDSSSSPSLVVYEERSKN